MGPIGSVVHMGSEYLPVSTTPRATATQTAANPITDWASENRAVEVEWSLAKTDKAIPGTPGASVLFSGDRASPNFCQELSKRCVWKTELEGSLQAGLSK